MFFSVLVSLGMPGTSLGADKTMRPKNDAHWLDSGGPLPTVWCLQGGRKVIRLSKPFFFFLAQGQDRRK
jgi:hypothetical protein